MLPDIRTVGVQGDERTYGSVIVIRAVTSDDAMTADWDDRVGMTARPSVGFHWLRGSWVVCGVVPA